MIAFLPWLNCLTLLSRMDRSSFGCLRAYTHLGMQLLVKDLAKTWDKSWPSLSRARPDSLVLRKRKLLWWRLGHPCVNREGVTGEVQARLVAGGVPSPLTPTPANLTRVVSGDALITPAEQSARSHITLFEQWSRRVSFFSPW